MRDNCNPTPAAQATEWSHFQEQLRASGTEWVPRITAGHPPMKKPGRVPLQNLGGGGGRGGQKASVPHPCYSALLSAENDGETETMGQNSLRSFLALCIPDVAPPHFHPIAPLSLIPSPIDPKSLEYSWYGPATPFGSLPSELPQAPSDHAPQWPCHTWGCTVGR